MQPLLALTVGVLFACGLYLMLRRNLLRFVFGLMLISNGANLLILTSGRLSRAAPPLIAETADVPDEAIVSALPQALVLTAIVISFGLTAFALALLFRNFEALGTLDTDELALEDDTLESQVNA